MLVANVTFDIGVHLGGGRTHVITKISRISRLPFPMVLELCYDWHFTSHLLAGLAGQSARV